MEATTAIPLALLDTDTGMAIATLMEMATTSTMALATTTGTTGEVATTDAAGIVVDTTTDDANIDTGAGMAVGIMEVIAEEVDVEEAAEVVVAVEGKPMFQEELLWQRKSLWIRLMPILSAQNTP